MHIPVWTIEIISLNLKHMNHSIQLLPHPQKEPVLALLYNYGFEGQRWAWFVQLCFKGAHNGNSHLFPSAPLSLPSSPLPLFFSLKLIRPLCFKPRVQSINPHETIPYALTRLLKALHHFPAIDFCPLIQRLPLCPISRLARSFLHHPISSNKIERPLHISCPQSNEMLGCDGEWFFSLLPHYVSCSKWNHVPLSFYRLMPKGGATDSTYRLTLRPRPITTTCIHHPITIGSVCLRSNNPHPSHSLFFQYPPTSHLFHLSSRSDGHPCSFIRLVHPLFSPRPLTIPCAQRTKVAGFPVPFVVSPQQLHLADSMAEEKKDRAWACNCI